MILAHYERWDAILHWTGFYQGLSSFFSLSAAFIFLTSAVLYCRADVTLVHNIKLAFPAIIAMAILFIVIAMVSALAEWFPFNFGAYITGYICTYFVEVCIFALAKASSGHSNIQSQVSRFGVLEIVGIDCHGREVFKF